MKRLIAFFLMCISPAVLMAQEYKTCKATYTYYASDNETPEQATRIAINRARTEALREHFTSMVSGATAAFLIEKNLMTSSKYVMLSSEGELNGEWVADLEPPKIEKYYGESGLIVTATVKGKGMEISANKIMFDAKILRNEPKIENESTEFVAGNSIFVHFTSPVDGYLAVYLLDGENAYCLLPYMGDSDGSFKVKHGQEYKLFSRKNPAEEENPEEIEEYSLTSDGDMQELNQIYIIFSPNKFRKAYDRHKQDADGTLYPRTMSWEDFQKWIIKTRRADREMAVQTQYIVVKPKNN